jgi:hypothetical protein
VAESFARCHEMAQGAPSVDSGMGTVPVSNWKNTADGVSSITQAIAISVAGVWGYFQFVRGRTFARRGELKIAGELLHGLEASALRVDATFRNTGGSRILFSEDTRVLRIFSVDGKAIAGATRIEWGERLRAVRLFEHHAWAESQESISDEVVVPLPADTGLRLILIVARIGARRRWFHKLPLVQRDPPVWTSQVCVGQGLIPRDSSAEGVSPNDE